MSQQNKFVSGLAALCAVVWVLAAIHPVDRQAWILENLLLVLFVATLAFAHRRLQLSNASYIFIALFVILHTIGAHYTYAKMPIGLWATDFFWHSRSVNCCFALAESVAAGVFGCRPRSSSRLAVFLKFWKASLLK